MSWRTARITPELRIQEVAPELCVGAFRSVKVADVDDPQLWLSFRSHYEEGLAPRLRETQHSALHMAVSFWRRQETAVALAKRFPKHGGYVARVNLTFGHGIGCLAQTDEVDPDHLTVWASAKTLAAAVVFIERV